MFYFWVISHHLVTIKITTIIIIIIIITTAPFYPVCCVTSISSSPLDMQCQKEIANQIWDLCLSYFEKLIFCWSVELSPRSLEYTTDSESKTPGRKILLTLSASILSILAVLLNFGAVWFWCKIKQCFWNWNNFISIFLKCRLSL